MNDVGFDGKRIKEEVMERSREATKKEKRVEKSTEDNENMEIIKVEDTEEEIEAEYSIKFPLIKI